MNTVKTAVIVRVPVDLLARIKDMAAGEERSVNQMMAILLREATHARESTSRLRKVGIS